MDLTSLSYEALMIARSQLTWTLRQFFHTRDYLEIEAPLVVHSPGLEPHLNAFEVKHVHTGTLKKTRHYLHTSPEYALKRLLGKTQRLKKIYSLTPCFRDEPLSYTHQPEFTLLEWYHKEVQLDDLMQECESLLLHLAQTSPLFNPSTQSLSLLQPWTREKLHWDLNRPFIQITMQEAFLKWASIDLNQCDHLEDFRLYASKAGVGQSALTGDWDELFFQIFMDKVEPHLGKEHPTFLTHFPARHSALARIDPLNPRWALRFELYLGGIELANAFDELSHAQEQHTRFKKDLQERTRNQRPLYPIDFELLEVLEGLGQCVGIALGFDRLLMLLLGQHTLEAIRPQPWTTLDL